MRAANDFGHVPQDAARAQADAVAPRDQRVDAPNSPGCGACPALPKSAAIDENILKRERAHRVRVRVHRVAHTTLERTRRRAAPRLAAQRRVVEAMRRAQHAGGTVAVERVGDVRRIGGVDALARRTVVVVADACVRVPRGPCAT